MGIEPAAAGTSFRWPHKRALLAHLQLGSDGKTVVGKINFRLNIIPKSNTDCV
jgi:hypothetical protein